MAEEFVRDNPDLKPFVLSDVQLTGTKIGGGAYGRVDEVVIPVAAAAKTIYAFLQEGVTDEKRIPKAATQFVRECKLMSSLRHPNIVQFLGLFFFSNSQLPALVMERLVTSLHDLLEPETSSIALGGPTGRLAFFTVDLKCSVLRDVASGLAFLHDQRPPVVHRDLSARNILLSSDMTAKIADLGVARIVPRMKAVATMTKGPGAITYMPPEAFAPASTKSENSKYDSSIDVFSFGIVSIFTIGENFPCDPLEPTYIDQESGLLKARTELQRRCEYMQSVYNTLGFRGQSREGHPLVQLITQCLHNVPDMRPSIIEVLHLLEEACIAGCQSEENKSQLISALQIHSTSQNLGHILQDLVKDSAGLQLSVWTKEKELVEIQERLKAKEELLQWSEKEKHTIREQLTVKEAEFRQAEEKSMQEQQQILEMKQQETERVQAKEEELAHTQQQLNEKEDQLRFSEALVANLQHQLQQAKILAPYIIKASGPGLLSATVNQPAHILVELSDYSGRPYSLHQNITATLEHVGAGSYTAAIK
jgi:serine/threonine protein kinase